MAMPKPVQVVFIGAVGLTMAGAGVLAASFLNSAVDSTVTVGGVAVESVGDAPDRFEEGRSYVRNLGPGTAGGSTGDARP